MKEQLLSLLKSSNGYTSGELMSSRLGVSRAAVWKCIEQLRKQGYIIESKTKKGYKLTGTPDVLYSWELKDLLDHDFSDGEIYHLNDTSSTNDVAHKLAMKNDNEKIIVISEHQSGGRGRNESTWHSPEGKGIYLSVALRPKISVNKLPQISIVVATAVCKALSEITGRQLNCRWPGDVIYLNKKLCGIMIEFNGELDKIRYIIAGIGIYVNISPEDFTELGIYDSATSLQIICGSKHSRRNVSAAVLNNLHNHEKLYKNGEFNAIFKEYRKLCSTIGQYIYLEDGTSVKCIDITENNELVVQMDNGTTSIL